MTNDESTRASRELFRTLRDVTVQDHRSIMPACRDETSGREDAASFDKFGVPETGNASEK